MSNSIIFKLWYGPHSGYTSMLIAAIIMAVQSCYYDVFINESEASPSEEATERHGIKATKVTRSIMIAISFFIAAFAIWKLWQP